MGNFGYKAKLQVAKIGGRVILGKIFYVRFY